MIAPAEIESAAALEAGDVEVAPVDAAVQPQTFDPVTAPAPTLASKAVDWTFLKATRFWAMTMANVSLILLDPNFPTQPWYVSLGKFLALEGGTFTLVKTVDKFSSK